MQQQILQKHRIADLHVYAVWVPFLGGTEDAVDLSRKVLPDRRVSNFWDGSALTSEWFAKNVGHRPGPAWDVYYLYGPHASWKAVPTPLVSSGSSIIGTSSSLEKAITPFLANGAGG